jgi:collagen type V/XI/XXIV/XXVII alpha
MPGDKLFQEGVMTFYNEVEKIRNTLYEVLKPNGSQAAPARTCYDLFLCNPDFQEGHYWIDPNIGGKQDALQVYCSKPGCSCIDHSLQDSSVPTFHADAGDKPFSELSKGYELPWPVHIDQIALLQLLSSSATQEFRYYGGTEKVDFVGADGEPLVVYDDEMTALKSRTDYMLSGEPEQFPILDFTPHDDTFGFEMGKACFCDELQ